MAMKPVRATNGTFEDQQIAAAAAAAAQSAVKPTPGMEQMGEDHKSTPVDRTAEARRRSDLYMALVQSGLTHEQIEAKMAEMKDSDSQPSE